MSISWGAQYPKLKTNLRLAINRLKLLGRKKTELAMKARSEIADYISGNKLDRARIRVEHIVREDYLVEAFEIVEMYCDLLLARFGLIEQMKTLDDGIAEAVISILWVAPRIATDIIEFKTVSDQLTVKYGKPFAEAARANQLEFPAKVNPKLIAKLSVAAPPKILVERYLIEIAAAAGLPFHPDEDVMREDEVHQAEKILIDFKNAGGPADDVNFRGSGGPPSNFGGCVGGNVGGFSGGGGGGAAVVGSGVVGIGHGPEVGMGSYGWNLDGNVPAGPARPPPLPPHQAYENENIYDDIHDPGHIYEVPTPATRPNVDERYDFPPGDYQNMQPTHPTQNAGIINLPKIGPNGLPVYPGQGAPPAGADRAYPNLSQRNSLMQPSNQPTAPPQSIRKPDDDEIKFPEPPTSFVNNGKPGGGGGNGGGGGGDLNFDELAKRFDELKRKQ